MHFFADNDVWKTTVDLLRAWGHNVITAREADFSASSDREILGLASTQDRILITRDSDFGALVFLGRIMSRGVILLRITPERSAEVHEELSTLLLRHSEAHLRKCFSTVEPGRHRMRLVPTKLDS